MSSTEMIGVDASGQARPMRTCSGLGVGCGQTDDHPMHVIDTGSETDDVSYHLDCHAAMGCQSCAGQIQGRPKNATGAKMLDHLQTKAAEAIADMPAAEAERTNAVTTQED